MILFIILMGSGLYFMVARSGFDLFLQSINRISLRLGLVLITLNVLAIFLVGWRLGVLLETVVPGMGFASISKINIIALASGYANIGKLNAPIKALLLKKTHNVSFSTSTPVLIAEQAFDFAALILVTLFAIALSGPYVPVTFRFLSELGWNSDKVADLILAITIIGSVGLALMWIARKTLVIVLCLQRV